MSTHTPGPWAKNDRNPRCEVWAGQQLVAQCFNYVNDIAELDARLIAKAPDMLSLLREARKAFTHVPLDGLLTPSQIDLLARIERCVVDATGERP